ncbi:hypothetical protein BDK51DRAFT_40937 [Blyttiomyces helicus]|uniref:Uncharacterized protein n=1 Tax=Blyttiomyces helicus TaxID=388810 RepID=A0A4V1IPS4_9FUNG|nr:hypothetical protein BDK51DRAFT_40937 [Blyttiomyces helicus]|eukprot:RKO84067.1 hypothetical protein BDK51DRAFT_40937 [Blyttiomyces helicus]
MHQAFQPPPVQPSPIPSVILPQLGLPLQQQAPQQAAFLRTPQPQPGLQSPVGIMPGVAGVPAPQLVISQPVAYLPLPDARPHLSLLADIVQEQQKLLPSRPLLATPPSSPAHNSRTVGAAPAGPTAEDHAAGLLIMLAATIAAVIAYLFSSNSTDTLDTITATLRGIAMQEVVTHINDMVKTQSQIVEVIANQGEIGNYLYSVPWQQPADWWGNAINYMMQLYTINSQNPEVLATGVWRNNIHPFALIWGTPPFPDGRADFCRNAQPDLQRHLDDQLHYGRQGVRNRPRRV